jgi:hypothetical protein
MSHRDNAERIPRPPVFGRLQPSQFAAEKTFRSQEFQKCYGPFSQILGVRDLPVERHLMIHCWG